MIFLRPYGFSSVTPKESSTECKSERLSLTNRGTGARLHLPFLVLHHHHQLQDELSTPSENRSPPLLTSPALTSLPSLTLGITATLSLFTVIMRHEGHGV